jgi:hypothetical protein
MPRLAPQFNGTPAVIEHRISFSNSERAMARKAIDAYHYDKYAENIPNYILAGGAVVAGAGIVGLGYGVYKVAQAIVGAARMVNIPDFVDDAKETASNAWAGAKDIVGDAIKDMAPRAPKPGEGIDPCDVLPFPLNYQCRQARRYEWI